jgi:hypothetical protein
MRSVIDANLIHWLAHALSQTSSAGSGLILATLAHVIWQGSTF